MVDTKKGLFAFRFLNSPFFLQIFAYIFAYNPIYKISARIRIDLFAVLIIFKSE